MPTETVPNQEEEFDSTPAGQAKRWEYEMKAAKAELSDWHKDSEKILKRFRNDRKGSRKVRDRRLNLFTSNIQTMRSLLYGKTPQVDVVRRYDDFQDDVARVAGQILQRLLNSDIEQASDGYSHALKHALDDRLLPGFGNAKARYVAQFTKVPAAAPIIGPDGVEMAPAVAETEAKSFESVHTDYWYWKDQRWSPCRTDAEKRWHAFMSPMSRRELTKRFGAVGRKVPLGSQREKGGALDQLKADPTARAEVWEIWDKETKTVYWWVEGYGQVLDSRPDPYELEGFFPFPTPMYANVTTSGVVPVPDFTIAEDLYNEIDELETRIGLLVKALKVVGVYDKNRTAVQRMLEDGTENQLIPVDNWALLAEKGGLKGIIDWLPLETVVAALDKLREIRSETITLLFQVTGMSDIMRGESGEKNVTATEQAIKAKFGSVRVQSFQDEFARFASELQQIKAQLICKFYDPQTILECSNIENTPDAALAQQAVEFLKSNIWQYRIQVKPESVSLTDYAAMRQERGEVIQTMSTFLQAVAPLMMQAPEFKPAMFKLLQWLVAGVRGASSIESVMDQAIAQAEEAAKNPQPPPPDPKLQATQMKIQGDLMKTKMDAVNRQHEISMEARSGIAQEAAKSHFSLQEIAAKARTDAMNAVNKEVPGET
jgi:hypothetical protein